MTNTCMYCEHCGGFVEYDKTIKLLTSPPQYKGVCSSCNAITSAFVSNVENDESLIEQNKKLLERCNPSKVIVIGDTGHYVSEAVHDAYKELSLERDELEEYVDQLTAFIINKMGSKGIPEIAIEADQYLTILRSKEE